MSLESSFNDEEKACFKNVANTLLADKEVPNDVVRAREIALVTTLSKLRVDTAVEKYKEFLRILEEYDLQMNDLYDEDSVLQQKLGKKWSENYEVCGLDKSGRSTMWISASKPNPISEEKTVVHAGIMYWMAVHSDIYTLRNGCTFVIDTSKQSSISKVGNERKLQKTWQSLPLRPKNIFIVGASFIKRVFINALIKFASLFSKSKVLSRVSFVEMDRVSQEFEHSELPLSSGGSEKPSVEEWVIQRIKEYNGVIVEGLANSDTLISDVVPRI
eukprot:GSMAST32.ASY1.ANO1.1470.1 assembled CDS